MFLSFSILPAPVQNAWDRDEERAKAAMAETTASSSRQLVSSVAPAAPPYGERQRAGWIPRTVADFGDGGAFPELHVAQYPLGMGKKESEGSGGTKSNALAVQLDAQGKVKYDLIARQGHGKDKVLKSRSVN
jgi:SNW domain-containing protein 1